MGVANAEQVRQLFLYGGMGFLLGAYYDVFRILRVLLKPRPFGVFIQDIVYFLTAAGMTFVFVLAVTDGVLRVYLFAGLLTGFFAYRYTVGRAVVRGITAVFGALSRQGARISEKLHAVGAKLRKKLKKFKKGLATHTDSGV